VCLDEEDGESVKRDKRRWELADIDGNKLLSRSEFHIFIHPEQAEHMKHLVVQVFNVYWSCLFSQTVSFILRTFRISCCPMQLLELVDYSRLMDDEVFVCSEENGT